MHCVEVGTGTCYADSNKARVLGDWVAREQDMTRAKCIQMCSDRGATLAGVEYGVQCMCGDALKDPQPSTACTMPCSGNSSEVCGGRFAIDVMHFQCS